MKRGIGSQYDEPALEADTDLSPENQLNTSDPHEGLTSMDDDISDLVKNAAAQYASLFPKLDIGREAEIITGIDVTSIGEVFKALRQSWSIDMEAAMGIGALAAEVQSRLAPYYEQISEITAGLQPNLPPIIGAISVPDLGAAGIAIGLESRALKSLSEITTGSFLPAIPVDLNLSIGLTALDSTIRTSIEPLFKAIEGFSGVLDSHGLQAVLDAPRHSGVSATVIKSLIDTRAALSTFDFDAVEKTHPVFSEFVEFAAEEIGSTDSGVAEVLTRLDSMDASMQSIAESNKQGSAMQRAMLVLAFLSLLIQATQLYSSAPPASDSHHSPSVIVAAPSHGIDVAVIEMLRQLTALASAHESERKILSNAPLRIEPHGTADEVCRLPADSVVSVLRAQGTWYQVETKANEDGEPGISGWIHRNHLGKK
ncbi:MAG: hypothetical protein KF875_06205 [Trueperaceae bacterium]|nr:hypothetical protein [Trueperaceae bacterium]